MWFYLLLTIALGDDCDGQLQSPIDVRSPFSYYDPEIDFYLGSQDGAILYHDGSTLRIDGDFGGFLWANSYFWSTGIIFRSPSEHQVEGSYMPMEMQIFFRDQYNYQSVISAFFTNSSQSNFLNEIGFGNPQLRDAEAGSLFKISSPVDVGSFLGDIDTYLYYEGSTTLSPCVPNVTWIVLTDTYKVSQEQLGNFPTSLRGQNREIQATEGRTIFSNFEDIETASGESGSSSGDDDTVTEDISSGEGYKDVNDDFIVENESYKEDFPEVDSIYTS
ncbi:unnamed protein product [Blepharisma stoltei]|uniref:carbonic anhydrase n=1 Tax=Blepharisma stoltei TaxID=1481888 RepID=A0AAU9J1R8_9CILI|nr:unnamed protein product [Blepharisma stoltei]